GGGVRAQHPELAALGPRARAGGSCPAGTGRGARVLAAGGAHVFIKGQEQYTRGGDSAGRDGLAGHPPATEEPRAPPSARTRYPPTLGAGLWLRKRSGLATRPCSRDRSRPRPKATPASRAGFAPAQRAEGLGGAPLAPPSSWTTVAGFTPAQRAEGLGGAPLAPPSSWTTVAGFTPAQ